MSTSYGFEKHLPHTRIDQAIETVTAALKQEGFGILSRIDVQETLKIKLNVDFRPYVILGACNPQLAHRALCVEPQIGLLLPCNVVVQAIGDGVDISIADPTAMFAIVDTPALTSVAEDAAARLRRALEAME